MDVALSLLASAVVCVCRACSVKGTTSWLHKRMHVSFFSARREVFFVVEDGRSQV